MYSTQRGSPGADQDWPVAAATGRIVTGQDRDRLAGSARAVNGTAPRTEDREEGRVRQPADGLRCVVECVEIVLLLGIGLLARATVADVETNIVGASQLANRKLLAGILGLLGVLAHMALFILPLALAVRMVVRRQQRRLVEAVGAGALAVAAAVGCNVLLRQPAAAPLYDELTLSARRSGHPAQVLDWYLAGLAAYVTVTGLSGHRRGRGGVEHPLSAQGRSQRRGCGIERRRLSGGRVCRARGHTADIRGPGRYERQGIASAADLGVDRAGRFWPGGGDEPGDSGSGCRLARG